VVEKQITIMQQRDVSSITSSD